jgi:aspartate/methionine/tyrosine aminotransferase
MSHPDATSRRLRGLRPSARVARTAPALIDLVGRAFRARKQAGGRLYPLAQAVPDFPPPPHVREALRASLERDSTHRYTVDPGLPELREAIARVLGGARGAAWSAEEQILVTAGANLAFAEVLPALADPGDEVLLLSPYYLNHGMAVELFGARTVEVPLDPDRGFAVDYAALERATTPRARVLVLVNPSNPTGAVLGRGDVEGLLRFAEAHDLWVVSDETYEDFVLEPPSDGWASAGSFPAHADRVVVLGSFSKSAGLSGWRVGWIVGPPELVHEVLKCHDTMIICAPVAAQHGALAALAGDRGWLEAHREELRRRRCVVLDSLAASPVLETSPGASRGAMFVLVRPRAGPLASSTATALDVIAETGVALVPGAAFGRLGEGWLRLSFAAAGEDELREALLALDDYFARRPRGVEGA